MLERRKGPASSVPPPQPSIRSPKRPAPAQAAPRALSKAPAPVARNPAKEAENYKFVMINKFPRVVPTPPRHRSAPYNPPRREEPDITALVETFTPPPVTPPVPPAVVAPGFRGSCKALCATTGRQCRLPAHPKEPDRHRNERGPFFRTAAPGTTSFPLRQALFDAATHQADGAAALVETKGTAQEKRESRRKSAHAGDAVTTGLKHLDSNAANTPHEDTEAA